MPLPHRIVELLFFIHSAIFFFICSSDLILPIIKSSFFGFIGEVIKILYVLVKHHS